MKKLIRCVFIFVVFLVFIFLLRVVLKCVPPFISTKTITDTVFVDKVVTEIKLLSPTKDTLLYPIVKYDSIRETEYIRINDTVYLDIQTPTNSYHINKPDVFDLWGKGYRFEVDSIKTYNKTKIHKYIPKYQIDMGVYYKSYGGGIQYNVNATYNAVRFKNIAIGGVVGLDINKNNTAPYIGAKITINF